MTGSTVFCFRRLDYDLPPGPYYTFKVQATDRGTPPLSSTSNIRIAVRNVNDEHPQFTIENGTEYRVSDVAQAGKVIAQIQATDLDGDIVSYSFDSQYLFILLLWTVCVQNFVKLCQYSSSYGLIQLVWSEDLYLSVAAHKVVWADPSLRYTSMLLGH